MKHILEHFMAGNQTMDLVDPKKSELATAMEPMIGQTAARGMREAASINLTKEADGIRWKYN